MSGYIMRLPDNEKDLLEFGDHECKVVKKNLHYFVIFSHLGVTTEKLELGSSRVRTLLDKFKNFREVKKQQESVTEVHTKSKQDNKGG